MKHIIMILILTIISAVYTQKLEPTYESKPMSAWLRDLADASYNTQKKASEALTAIGKPSVAPLIKIISMDNEISLRSAAIYTLGNIGKDAKECSEILLRIIMDDQSDFNLKDVALKAFKKIGTSTIGALPKAIKYLQDGTLEQKKLIAILLNTMGSEAHSAAIPILMDIQKNDKEFAENLVKEIFKLEVAEIMRAKEDVLVSLAHVSNVLQRRSDLILSLTKIIRSNYNIDRNTLEDLMNARNKMVEIKVDSENPTPDQLKKFFNVQNELYIALVKLMTLTESDQGLISNKNFINIKNELDGTENRVAVERRKYNESVYNFNEKRKSWPPLLVETLGIGQFAYFEARVR